MARISKRTLKQIEAVSVFDAILREHFTSSLTGYFADDRPEHWQDEEKKIFDIASEVEYRLKDEILKVLARPITSRKVANEDDT